MPEIVQHSWLFSKNKDSMDEFKHGWWKKLLAEGVNDFWRFYS
jgi:hypothetical protein